VRLAQVLLANSTQVAGEQAGESHLVCDRLSHQGGLSGTAAGAQTTNLPTAALTRYTSGVGVFAALEIYSTVGTTATTVTASYTNESGSSGRTSPAMAFGGTNEREVGRIVVLPLQSGDVGVRSVESVTLAGTTGSVGNFGVTLFRPLAFMPAANIGGWNYLYDGVLAAGVSIPQVVSDACLFTLTVASASGYGQFLMALNFIQE
jgi:hypothetical protein